MKPRFNFIAAGGMISALAILCAVAAAACSGTKSSPVTQSTDVLAIGQRTKSSGCAGKGGLPDAACTPGAIISAATTQQICRTGYSTSVRNVSLAEKDQVYAEYGIPSHRAGEYEVDHLIPLEVGGSNEIANLWPQPASPAPGYHEKDRFENYLHDQLCSGKLSLAQAQGEAANDWLKYWAAAGEP